MALQHLETAPERLRVVVVGAGPAGTRCAEALVAAGITPTVVDENNRDGGQIYRRQPEGFTRPYAQLYGSEAAKAQALHESFDRLRPFINYLPQTLAWNITADQLHCVSNGVHATLDYDAVVLCTGATDRLMPVRGWQLPGNYSLGGAQIGLKAQAIAIGRKVTFLGTGPLLYLVAKQYLDAGVPIAAVLDTSSRMKKLGALPKLLAQPKLLLQGFKYWAQLRLARVPVYQGVEPLEIKGNAAAGVSAICFHASRQIRKIDCDAVASGYHLRPEAQLADLAGCEFHFDEHSAQWLLTVDSNGRTSVAGVYSAGDSASVRGADAAEQSGWLVAQALLKDQGQAVDNSLMQASEQRLQAFERFRIGINQAFQWPAHLVRSLTREAIVCRCEMITAGELRDSATTRKTFEFNRVKAFCRVGMGRCQGRYCSQAGAEVIAEQVWMPVKLVGRQRSQAPVKPIPLAFNGCSHESE